MSMVLIVTYAFSSEEDWAAEKCPHGDVLRNEKTSRPVTCSQRIDDDEFKSGRVGGRNGRGRRGRRRWLMVSDKWGIGKRINATEKKNVCPQTHICTMVSKPAISVCCPRNTKG